MKYIFGVFIKHYIFLILIRKFNLKIFHNRKIEDIYENKNKLKKYLNFNKN